VLSHTFKIHDHQVTLPIAPSHSLSLTNNDPLQEHIKTSTTQTTTRSPAKLPIMVKQFGNIYLIAAIAVIGGGLFGFDISSMSAM